MAATRKDDLYSDRFRAETYATFAQMRAEDPVFCRPGQISAASQGLRSASVPQTDRTCGPQDGPIGL